MQKIMPQVVENKPVKITKEVVGSICCAVQKRRPDLVQDTRAGQLLKAGYHRQKVLLD
ncbi:hypothetical protein [Paenibacillus sp. FSL K6-2524]|uniref:hypothetical protein n=1 Tax=Paenibacillus sp. FSL K6-2524 TaxID=2954516 RepID=UPI0030F514D7